MLPPRITFVDVETTGGRSAYDRIIEIGMLRVENNEVARTFSSLINPHTYIPQEIERLTGITQKDVERAPSFREVADEILEMLDESIFVAHNVRFDYGFLKQEFLRLNTAFSSKQFCTVRLSRNLFPAYRHHNLDSIIERFGLRCESRHRALDDAKVIYEFYLKIQEKLPPEKIGDAVDKAMKKPSLPLYLTQSAVDRLPDQPGVYIFYGEQDAPLYVGKSKNIRNRVLSHFSSDIRSNTEMKISQQVRRVEALPTAGELGALVLESQLIKKLLPLYNRRLRLKHELIALRESRQNGYQTVKIEPVTAILPLGLSTYIGFFRSRKQAKTYLTKLRAEYYLCDKLLQLENTQKACFSYRLGLCRGACIGKESVLRYNLRHSEAFASAKIKPWPFPGPIALSEYHPFSGLRETFIVNKWCLIGSLQTDDNGAEQFIPRNKMVFDLDTYKILKGYLFNQVHIEIKAVPPDTLRQIKEEMDFTDRSMQFGIGESGRATEEQV